MLVNMVKQGSLAGTSTDASTLSEPTNIVVTGAASSITVTWTDALNTTSTFIYFSSVSGQTAYHGYADVGTETYTISGLSADTYYIALMSHNSVKDTYSTKTSEYSDAVGEGVSIPSVPSAFTASVASSSSIDLAWTDNSDDESGFVIQQSADGESGWSTVITTGTNVTSSTDSGLTASTEYFYQMRAFNDAGNSAWVAAAASATTSAASASSLIYSQNFESAGWESDFTGSGTWGDHVARVTDSPYEGTYSLRGNQLPAVTDTLTSLAGHANPLLDWRGGGSIVALTPNELYFSYRFRHDDYNHDLDDDGSGEGKLVFFVDDTYSIQGMYLNNQLAQRNSLRLKYSNGGYSDSWASTNWGYTSLTLTNANVSGNTSGTWRRLEYYINYDDKYVQFWVDGNIMKSSKHGNPSYPKLTSDGKSYYDPALTLKTKGFQFFWVRAGNIDESTDGTGYYAGWQIDDLQVWDGMP